LFHLFIVGLYFTASSQNIRQ